MPKIGLTIAAIMYNDLGTALVARLSWRTSRYFRWPGGAGFFYVIATRGPTY